MKHLEGKTVYLRPTGNNVRHHKQDKDAVIVAKLVKVARVNATFEIDGWERKYRYEDNRLIGDCNSGYVVYETAQALQDYRESCRIGEKISTKFRFGRAWSDLGIDKLRIISEMLELDKEK